MSRPETMKFVYEVEENVSSEDEKPKPTSKLHYKAKEVVRREKRKRNRGPCQWEFHPYYGGHCERKELNYRDGLCRKHAEEAFGKRVKRKCIISICEERSDTYKVDHFCTKHALENKARPLCKAKHCANMEWQYRKGYCLDHDPSRNCSKSGCGTRRVIFYEPQGVYFCLEHHPESRRCTFSKTRCMGSWFSDEKDHTETGLCRKCGSGPESVKPGPKTWKYTGRCINLKEVNRKCGRVIRNKNSNYCNRHSALTE